MITRSLIVTGALLIHAPVFAQAVGTAKQRVALLHELVVKTLSREAFAPAKGPNPSETFRVEALALEPRFSSAGDETELFFALVELSNLRHDSHLVVEPVPGGLRPSLRATELPLRFGVDHGVTPPTLFVRDRAADLERFELPRLPQVGDRVVAVHGEPTASFVERFAPLLGCSTEAVRWQSRASELSLRRRMAASLYTNPLRLRLASRDGRTFEIEVPYRERVLNRWTTEETRTYSQYETLDATRSYRLQVQDDAPGLVVLEWLGFGKSLGSDLDRLVEVAADRGLLDHDVILDLTTARGGKHGARLVRRLTTESFRVTRRNLRLDAEVIESFTESQTEKRGSSHPRIVWLRDAVAPALRAGEDYSPSIPYTYEDGDGTVPPASNGFRGRLVCLLAPTAGSQVDQVAAMIVDNGLGHAIGMPCGGFSNAWEWSETIELPGDSRPLARFSWSIGHTLRPNGEVLEGNPAEPHEIVPMTRNNHANYRATLLTRAMRYLRESARPPR